jgi:hypothetical protein
LDFPKDISLQNIWLTIRPKNLKVPFQIWTSNFN